MIRKLGLIFFLSIFSVSLVSARSLKERTTRDAQGQWVTESYVEVGKYKERRDINVELEVKLGNTVTTSGSPSYWVEVEHEVKFHKYDLSTQEAEKSALRLGSVTINGVVINSNNQNTTINMQVRKGKMKERIRVMISRQDAEAIVNSSLWEGSIISGFFNDRSIPLYMKSQHDVSYSLRRLV